MTSFASRPARFLLRITLGVVQWNYETNHYLLDGEWWRLDTRLQYAFKEDMALGVAIPFVGQTGGFADGGIERFHKTFGFDNANRATFPRNQSLEQVTTGSVTRTILEGDT